MSADIREIEGEVARITYRSDDGYTVLKLETEKGQVTCVGHFARIGPGDHIKASGTWVKHARYGEQFSVTSYQVIPPRSREGIVRYLSSGFVEGVGKSIAERIVSKFGEETIAVIEKEPNRLREVEGVGRKRVAAIRKAWKENREMSELIVFLESQGISGSKAVRIHKQYGSKSIEVMRENPYRLASEIWGIGFATADRMAGKLGIPPDAPMRVRAGIQYLLTEATDEGHVFLPLDFLASRCTSLLGIGEDDFDAALEGLVSDRAVLCDRERVYLPRLLEAEVSLVSAVKGLVESESEAPMRSAERVISNVQSEYGVYFDESQLEAVREGLRSRLAIITGGPGTGKTTIVQAFVRIYEAEGLKVSLAAPTGRAAKRMSEVAHREARTIHRLLEYSPQDGTFGRNADSPLDAQLIVVDEASMLDLLLASSLLRAITPSTSLILVGDVDQLPPVGPGNFLRDLISSRQVPVRRLTRVFRQDEGGAIVENAHRINQGDFPVFSKPTGEFFFIHEEEPERVAGLIVDLCANRIPSKLGFDPIDDIQVLAPMYKGQAGATNLNSRLQAVLNPGADKPADHRFRIGDKVMQLRNNYDKMVFNGDIGRVVEVDPEGPTTVQFDTRVTYERSEIDEITLAYAITVHKSQGSEFPCVVMPVLTQHYMMLYRNLLYTAVTRARSMVVLVGSRRAVGLAVSRVRTDQRFSSLAERLSEAIM